MLTERVISCFKNRSVPVFILDSIFLFIRHVRMNMKTLTLSLGADVAQVNRQISTAGVEFMDAALDAVIVALKSIRDQADSVLRKIEQPRRERSLAWK